MQFVVKFFSEIIMKSKPVRRQLAGQLEGNLRAVLRDIDADVAVQRGWDKLTVQTGQADGAVLAELLDAMCNTPGIALVQEVQTHPLPELDAIVEAVLPVYETRLAGRRFAVRCKRSGQHDFTSIDVERVVGSVHDDIA